ncbi:TMEM175 family protein [Fructobacillus tropaeoli]|uniref:TMEM175 family protein n=1 Tax=Fructobacillus tropaeoli TaxID=709323 RepID=UPI001F50DE00|nr:TMEM175 family protein [Fructobacillus tropaeoli]
MMTKSRLEGFTDGILVIIFTIMILEFKVPNSSNITAILKQFPYFISYSIGWLFLGEAWYNHLYIASKIHRVTHKLFVINALWLFTTSFLPLATAWIGQDLSARGPEIFYGLVFLVWTAAFLLLVFTAILDNKKIRKAARGRGSSPNADCPLFNQPVCHCFSRSGLAADSYFCPTVSAGHHGLANSLYCWSNQC